MRAGGHNYARNFATRTSSIGGLGDGGASEDDATADGEDNGPHFVSTDEKLDRIGGRLVQNEVRIAHIEEEKMEEHEDYMINRLDQHDKHAKERLQQQDQHIMDMGHEQERHHKTVLVRLEDFGEAQAMLQEQSTEQENSANDRKMAELERGIKEAKEAAEARAHAQAGTDSPGEMTLRVAGFERDTPAGELERVARKYMVLTTMGRQQMNDAAAACAGDVRPFSPYLLSSFALVHTSIAWARRMVAEAKQ